VTRFYAIDDTARILAFRRRAARADVESNVAFGASKKRNAPNIVTHEKVEIC